MRYLGRHHRAGRKMQRAAPLFRPGIDQVTAISDLETSPYARRIPAPAANDTYTQQVRDRTTQLSRTPTTYPDTDDDDDTSIRRQSVSAAAPTCLADRLASLASLRARGRFSRRSSRAPPTSRSRPRAPYFCAPPHQRPRDAALRRCFACTASDVTWPSTGRVRDAADVGAGSSDPRSLTLPRT